MRLSSLSAFAVIIGVGLAAPHARDAAAQQAGAARPSTRDSWPADIDRASGFRLSLPRREDLDEVGKATFDRFTAPGASIAGLQGPNGVQLYSPRIAGQVSAVNGYLRRDAGISPRLREIAILVTAREFDSQFEWTAHEREALKEGAPVAAIDAIKFRKPLEGLDPADKLVIELGRELWRDHKVSSATFALGKQTFGPNKLIDIILLMGNYAGTAALLTAVDMQLHEGETPLLPLP
jgi:4-carboxymuconolactone decarboxylase